MTWGSFLSSESQSATISLWKSTKKCTKNAAAEVRVRKQAQMARETWIPESNRSSYSLFTTLVRQAKWPIFLYDLSCVFLSPDP
jgi:hypothetical protein